MGPQPGSKTIIITIIIFARAKLSATGSLKAAVPKPLSQQGRCQSKFPDFSLSVALRDRAAFPVLGSSGSRAEELIFVDLSMFFGVHRH